MLFKRENNGAYEGIALYDGEKYGDFENYKKYWIIREMVIFINSKITDIKNEFKRFFKDKRENFGKEEHIHSEEDGEVYLKRKTYFQA